MFDRRLLQSFNWPLLLVTLVLAFIGVLTLFSAVEPGGDDLTRVLCIKQLIWLGIAAVVMICTFLIHYNLFDRYGFFIWLAAVLLLAWVLLFGRVISGSQRWLHIGPLSFQPSEFAKIAIMIMLARHFSRAASEKGLVLRDLGKPLLWLGVPCALILRQPDLGTTILICLIAGTMTMFMKIRRRSLLYLVTFGLAAVPSVWFSLKEYQKERIFTFLNPDRDPLGAGYHIIQSKIAIGSGMLTGKGYMQGTQKSLSFLPEQHTDFIFSVLAEEWGFVGSGVLLLMFMLLIVWGLGVAYRSKDPFGAVLAVGVVSMIFWQVFINIGMVMGLMPVVGVPLPLVSYGGSSVLTTMVGIGILLNISMRRFLFE
ncbi:MAG: rod shape-determining protein RodA [Desulfatibacillaceae bacterium]